MRPRIQQSISAWVAEGLEGRSLKATLRLYVFGLALMTAPATVIGLAFGADVAFLAAPFLVLTLVGAEYIWYHAARWADTPIEEPHRADAPRTVEVAPTFKGSHAFIRMTLVESMVIVAIIAIVAAIAITLYQDVQRKAKLAADEGVVAAMNSGIAIYYGKALKSAIAAYYEQHGRYPDNPSLLLDDPKMRECVRYRYDVSTGRIDDISVAEKCPK